MKQKENSPKILTAPFFWPVVILIATFISYFSSLWGDFTNWDDHVYVRDNPYISSLAFDNLRAIFSSNYMGNYHPLAMLSLTIDYQIFGYNPLGFHLTNLLLHLVNSWLVYMVIKNLTGKQIVAGFAGVLFGVHTLHVESVTWISERKDVLYTLFYLLALQVYILYCRKKEIKWLGLALLLFLLSCLSKGQAVTLAPTLILVDIFLGRKWNSMQVLMEKVPFFILSMIFGMVAIRAQAGADATIMANFPFIQRIAFASYGLLMYVLKLVVPYPLSAYYPYPIVSGGDEVPFGYWLTVIPAIALVAVWIISYKKSKPLFFGISFFLVNIVLLLQLLPVGRAIMADRYAYIPSIGFVFLAGWYLNERKIIPSQAMSLIILGVYVIFLGILTFQRGKVWKDSMTLWSDVLEKNSRVPVAWYNRGNLKIDNGDYQGAIEDYSEAINVDEGYWKAYINRGNAKNQMKNYLGAIEDFNAVLAIDSGAVNAYVNRANSYKLLGDPSRAIQDYDRAIRMNPDQIELYTNRSNTKYELKDYQGALDDISEAIRKKPDYATGYSNRAYIRKAMDDLPGAIEDYTRAIEIKPDNSDYYNNRGNLKFQTGDMQGALSDYSSSITISPDNYLGYKNRGALYLSQDKPDEALVDFNQAVLLNPKLGELYYSLAQIYDKKDNTEEKVRLFLKAAELDPVFSTGNYREKLNISASVLANLAPTQLNEQGKSLEAGGRLTEATEIYRKVVASSPDFAEGWFNLGNILGKTGQFPEAIRCLDKAISLRDNYVEAIATRGISYASIGKPDDAVRDLTKAISLNSTYAAAYFNRALVYINTGKKDLACDDLKKAIDNGHNAAYQIYQKECQGR